MSVSSNITDSGNGRQAKVVLGNALAINPPHPDLAFNAELGTDDVVVNIVPAKADHIFCITALLLTGNKNIDQSIDAVVEIYTADSESTAAASSISSLFLVPVARSSSRDITGILAETPEGKWINGVTSDDDVFVTILGYYVRED